MPIRKRSKTNDEGFIIGEASSDDPELRLAAVVPVIGDLGKYRAARDAEGAKFREEFKQLPPRAHVDAALGPAGIALTAWASSARGGFEPNGLMLGLPPDAGDEDLGRAVMMLMDWTVRYFADVHQDRSHDKVAPSITGFTSRRALELQGCNVAIDRHEQEGVFVVSPWERRAGGQQTLKGQDLRAPLDDAESLGATIREAWERVARLEEPRA